jgi:ribonuclease HII
MSQRLEQLRLKSLCAYERRVRTQGYQAVAGVDEAGRGPLAGPVVAAACIIPEGIYFEGIDDSKKLDAKKREEFYNKIQENPEILSGVGIVDAIVIDQVNILRATMMAMIAAVAALRRKPDYILVDGNRLPEWDTPAEAIIDGDCLSQSIMAAAIIAKTTRDRMMAEFDLRWPHYGFKEHKGYGTGKHIDALKVHGPCPIHRKTFAPVKSLYCDRSKRVKNAEEAPSFWGGSSR